MDTTRYTKDIIMDTLKAVQGYLQERYNTDGNSCVIGTDDEGIMLELHSRATADVQVLFIYQEQNRQNIINLWYVLDPHKNCQRLYHLANVDLMHPNSLEELDRYIKLIVCGLFVES